MKEATLTKIAFIIEEVALQLNDQFNPSASPLSGTLLGTRPREWAQAVRDLPKFRHIATK